MEKEKLVAFLKNSGLVTLQKAAEIASHFTRKIIYKSDFYLREGKVCNEYLFLENGFIRAFAYDINGNDITTHFYWHNQVVFEVSSFSNARYQRRTCRRLQIRKAGVSPMNN